MAPHTDKRDHGTRAPATETLPWSVDQTMWRPCGISHQLVKRLLAEGKLTPLRIRRALP